MYMLVLPFLHLHRVKLYDFAAKLVFEYFVVFFFNKPKLVFEYFVVVFFNKPQSMCFIYLITSLEVEYYTFVHSLS